ncbi:MAG: molybdenum cofactor guanylyltransferase MobA [Pseudomonadota bacterium]|jgi:molybdopterin-guanine dinucleotide biosynthesis protein A|uniref:molybdenum cofactor guanylyltransferase MobA n=1 Tax=unclassified Polaromonas TaxID=2638319 RepID=UPI000BCB9CAA|nr:MULTISPECIES: molybdenum cofactor guanylyltransferase MobA [unclassified Polaromonas]MDO8374136.1 molybdenum cofactor guanylyltransferase MobA [Polaromonas sp.]OYY36992.1 MAG: molybdenum cofactor guanylyltransferase MobA [Polaromonas sp. 35-63-35]OYZ20612.1 MAG: molybdenum cofactor guanylyltransferase MobA [Polaromonas sp. 16-63-31]OYZ78751.1 MAG: molybdenum cofactor guanylyltransferase MobA [Polaromonas sp. 24-63-21]OZA49736.1 MAG: molybdenum cofactor guanylyltransferase MobA [Polaromonas 
MIDTIDGAEITGIILAGGRGSRMGGADKGLQSFNGVPLALHTLLRLSPQVGEVMVNANRNLAAYESFGVPVWPDAAGLGEFSGPLAGFLTGLERCETPYLLTVPCDTPLFSEDLVARLAEAMVREDADIAVVAAPEEDGQLRAQPVFCLLHTRLLESLMLFTTSGGRKIDAWTAQHKTVLVPFNQPGDDPRAFFNANTLAELHQLEALRP